jgi:signal recognition particle receptor subunit beta
VEHKILFTGTMGAGKTTAIAAVSEIAPIRTEVRNSDASVAKATTTVGLDYGELTLDNGEKLRLYGTPGQIRFDFMWRILARGALGLVILVDNSRPDPLADLDVYLDGFAELIEKTACVIGVGRTETASNWLRARRTPRRSRACRPSRVRWPRSARWPAWRVASGSARTWRLKPRRVTS